MALRERLGLGQSIFLNKPVLAAPAERAEPTLFAILIAAAIALPIGVLAAYRRGSVFDQVVATIAMMSASIPSFWLGLVAQHGSRGGNDGGRV